MRQLQQIDVAVAPDQHRRQHPPLGAVQAAELRAGAADIADVIAQQVLQERLRFHTRNAQRAELAQVAQHRAAACGEPFCAGSAEMAEDTVLYMRAWRWQE